MAISRRQFVKLVGAVAAATGLPAEEVAASITPAARAQAAEDAAELTTLAQRLQRRDNPGEGEFQDLDQTAAGEAHIDRAHDEEVEGVNQLRDLTDEQRDERRVPVVSFIHHTDQHITDAQAPMRLELVRELVSEQFCADDRGDLPLSSAWRAQEVAGARITDAMNKRLADIVAHGSPVTGEPIDAAICTGDNIDNQQDVELDVHMAVMSGGLVRFNTGDPNAYEGVMNSGRPWYWHPDPADANFPDGGFEGSDADRFTEKYGYPEKPDYALDALGTFTALGAPVPWYTCYGNHDGLVQGNLPPHHDGLFDDVLVGDEKLEWLPMLDDAADNGMDCDLFGLIGAILAAAPSEASDDPFAWALELARTEGGMRTVTPDNTAEHVSRQVIDRTQWVQRHLDNPHGNNGGPAGHGYTEDNLNADGEAVAYYAADVGGARWLVLDTVNPGGIAQGSIGAHQLKWLEQELQRADRDGRPAILFSHHGLRSLSNPIDISMLVAGMDPTIVDPFRVTASRDLPEGIDETTGEPWPEHWAEVNQRAAELGDQVTGPLEVLISDYRCAIAWVNGHTHRNNVTPRLGFWDINTAAHIDWPCQSRLIDVVDNRDGTWSIFCTMVDHAGFGDVDGDDDHDTAHFARELAMNEPDRNNAGSEGDPEDRNVELLIADPFPERASARRVPSPEAQQAAQALSDGPLPAGLTVAGALAIAGVVGVARLRERAERHGHVDADGRPAGPRGEAKV